MKIPAFGIFDITHMVPRPHTLFHGRCEGCSTGIRKTLLGNANGYGSDRNSTRTYPEGGPHRAPGEHRVPEEGVEKGETIWTKLGNVTLSNYLSQGNLLKY